jgi:hypothetical protein
MLENFRDAPLPFRWTPRELSNGQIAGARFQFLLQTL